MLKCIEEALCIYQLPVFAWAQSLIKHVPLSSQTLDRFAHWRGLKFYTSTSKRIKLKLVAIEKSKMFCHKIFNYFKLITLSTFICVENKLISNRGLGLG
jgi:hypothetical protein